MKTDNDFCKRLIKLRTSKDLSQFELESLALLPDNVVDYYETGERQPGLQAIKSLCRGLGCTPNQLLGKLKVKPVEQPTLMPVSLKLLANNNILSTDGFIRLADTNVEVESVNAFDAYWMFAVKLANGQALEAESSTILLPGTELWFRLRSTTLSRKSIRCTAPTKKVVKHFAKKCKDENLKAAVQLIQRAYNSLITGSKENLK